MMLVHDQVMQLPRGYNEPMGANGSGLSGGERQRVLLGNAIIRVVHFGTCESQPCTRDGVSMMLPFDVACLSGLSRRSSADR